MNCIELSLKSLESECKEWAEKISKEYRPDVLIYVANAGYPISLAMNEVFCVPLIGIEAQREGNKLKSKIGWIFKKMPNFVRNILIAMELKSGIHGKSTERNIKWLDETEKYTECRKILVVDDSIDTGVTLVKVKEEILKVFKNAEVKVAGMNVWDKSEENIISDYSLYRNTIIKAPMSKDSKEYNEYLEMLKKR